MSITDSRSVPFAALPDEARLWIFASADAVSPGDAEEILARVDAFLQEWHAHGHPVVGGRDWRYDRFLMIAADETATGVSGCSTDSLFRVLKGVERDLGVKLLDRSLVWYREGDSIRSASRAEFRALAKGGDTVVFDQTAPTVGAVRRGEWERPLRESWHAQAFRQPAA